MQFYLKSGLIISLLAATASAKHKHDPPHYLKKCSKAAPIPHPPEQGKEVLNGLTGDVLNITKCYCEAPALDRWGFHFQADYANYHNGGRIYQTHWTCDNETLISPSVPYCWSEDTRGQRVLPCDTDDQENQFCYGIQAGHVWLDILDTDFYTFNLDKRDMWNQRANESPKPDECKEYCKKLGGMQPSRDSDDTYTKTIHYGKGHKMAVCSSKQVYNNLPDMCWHCRKEE